MDDKDIENRIHTLTAMASNLTPYLYENELFGHLGDHLPKLTVGGLLLRLHQLEYLEPHLSHDQQTRIHDARINFEETRHEWSVHYEEKIVHELKSRLSGLTWYLEDCSRGEGNCAADWQNEAEKRTIVAHLEAEAEAAEVLTDELRDEINHVDQRLRRLVHSGQFLWDAKLSGAYPQDKYWWLYGNIREAD